MVHEYAHFYEYIWKMVYCNCCLRGTSSEAVDGVIGYQTQMGHY